MVRQGAQRTVLPRDHHRRPVGIAEPFVVVRQIAARERAGDRARPAKHGVTRMTPLSSQPFVG